MTKIYALFGIQLVKKKQMIPQHGGKVGGKQSWAAEICLKTEMICDEKSFVVIWLYKV